MQRDNETPLKCFPTELHMLKPDKRPSFITLSNFLIIASITMTNSKGDKGSHCLNPYNSQKTNRTMYRHKWNKTKWVGPRICLELAPSSENRKNTANKS